MVEEHQAEFTNVLGVLLIVLLEDARLKELEAFRTLVGKAEIHAGFVVFQLGTVAEYALNRDVERSAEIESDVGDGSEAVKIAKPAMGAAAGSVASEGGVNVAIGEDKVVALEKRHDLALATVGKIGSVQQ